MMQCLKKFLYHVNTRQLYNRIRVQLSRHCTTNTDLIEEDLQDKLTYGELSNEYLGRVTDNGVFVLQPYIKWGKDKRRNTTPVLQLSEAVALIRTLRWTVVDKMCVSLLTLEKKTLLGSGNLAMLRKRIQSNPQITAIFISTNKLKHSQIHELQSAFEIPVFDRYSIVIHIFRAHAFTPEARLQVALAELPYIRKKMYEINDYQGGQVYSYESRERLLELREIKLKTALKKLKHHREMLRNNKARLKFPSIAVVGYTNSGKTSLIKVLTEDKSLKPRDVLFATLDTTAHEGTLPCSMKVLYMDTIGFIQDIPETLIEPFRVTFEDAIVSDIIVHVYDISHPDVKAQVEHVEQTLASMAVDKPIIKVANKCDLTDEISVPDNTLAISCVTFYNIENLRMQIQNAILAVTNQSYTCIRVDAGGPAATWLYKETTVMNVEADPNNPQYQLFHILSNPLVIMKFKNFCKK